MEYSENGFPVHTATGKPEVVARMATTITTVAAMPTLRTTGTETFLLCMTHMLAVELADAVKRIAELERIVRLQNDLR